MQMKDFNCKAGIPATQHLAGRYLRVLAGKGRLRLETDNGHSSEILTGIGVDLLDAQSGRGFTQVNITSDVDQVVTVLVSTLPTTDSRLSGDVDVNGLLQVLNKGGTRWASSTVSLVNGTKQLLPANGERLNASIQADTDLWIGSSPSVTTASGIKVTAGQTLSVENSAALYARAVEAGTARIMESLA